MRDKVTEGGVNRRQSKIDRPGSQPGEAVGLFVPGAFQYRPILMSYLSGHPDPLLRNPQPHLLLLGTFCFYSRLLGVQLHCTILPLLIPSFSLGDASPCQPL